MKTSKKPPQKTIKIEKHIGIYDNYILPQDCDKAIKLFEEQNAFKKTFGRMQTEGAPPTIKNDKQLFLAENVKVWFKELRSLIVNLDIAVKHYQHTTGIIKLYDLQQFDYTSLKIQKTLPTQGYHVWHIEHGAGIDNSNRALVYTVYLNDVKKGGETEFLHQSMRVQPKKGRIVIFPAAFPFVHRGNPPLKGEKYLLTSWLNLPVT